MALVITGSAQGLVAKQQTPGELIRFTFTEYHMGIDARLVVYARSKKAAEDACEGAFKRIAELEAVMSDYRPDSELMRLCKAPAGKPVKVSEDLFRVLVRSQTIARQSGGAFDITVGPLVQLWRKARKDKVLPPEAEIDAAKALVGWQKLHLDPRTRTATLDVAGMRLDLGGIGKGFASDEALRVLRQHGVNSALIEMGGDLVLGDAPPKTAGWTVDVPNAPLKNGAVAQMTFKNCAVSSSGDTEQFVEIDGVRYSHVVDPKTGHGLTERAQATVIAKDGFTSDPLSTAVTILDPAGQEQLLRNYPGLTAYVKRISSASQ